MSLFKQWLFILMVLPIIMVEKTLLEVLVYFNDNNPDNLGLKLNIDNVTNNICELGI